MRGVYRIGLATAAFALLHSALASRVAKNAAARLLGERQSDGLYRAFFTLQALLSFGLLLAYGRRLPTRTLYPLHGPLALLLRAGQAAGLLHALYAAREVGVARLAGWTNAEAWWRGRVIPPGPAAQGPEWEAEVGLPIGGPFRWSRHPLNLSPLPIFWLTPHLTTLRLAFNLVSTLYLVLGSRHEEVRLRAAYGEAYAAYQRSGVPFYLPRPSQLARA